jgi:4-carboxymuconolactone decarboxylase
MTDRPPPRVSPLSDAELPADVTAALGQWRYNLHRCLAHSPETLMKWMPYAVHVLQGNAVPAREREIAILRVAWNARSDYEWGLHARLARSIGMSERDLEAIANGPEDTHFGDVERALLACVDELQRDWAIADETYKTLASALSPKQIVDLLFVIGQFMLVAILLNGLRVPLEPGVPGLPEAKS